MKTDMDLPPHDSQSELASLGCSIQEPHRIADLNPALFYDLRHRTLAEALIAMAAGGRCIGADTLSQYLTARGLTDAFALVCAATDACFSPANEPYWRETLEELYQRRKMLQVCRSGADGAMNRAKPFGETLQAFESEAMAIRQSAGADKGDVNFPAVVDEVFNDYEGKGEPLPCYSTGICDLDQLTGGLKEGELIIVAGRPGDGKTSVALGFAAHLAVEQKIPVAFFSLEMSGRELIHRLASSYSKTSGKKLRMGRFENLQNRSELLQNERPQIKDAHSRLSKAPLHIYHKTNMTVPQLKAKARAYIHMHGVKVVIVDYLGLIRYSPRARSPYEGVTEISRELKELATDLQVPLVVLAQLNRGSDREDRPPRLSDLRDSGAIEQDADVVMLLHTQKPDKENAAEVEAYDSGNPLVKLMLSKNRQGPTGNVMLQFLQSQFRFVPWNPRNPSEARARNYSKEDFRASAEDWKSQSGMD